MNRIYLLKHQKQIMYLIQSIQNIVNLLHAVMVGNVVTNFFHKHWLTKIEQFYGKEFILFF